MARTVAQKRKTVSKAPAGLDRLTQQAAAWLLGITPRALRMRQDLPRNDDGSYDGAAVVAAYSEARCKTAATAALKKAASNAGSDGLERFRRAKAALVEMDLDERRGDLVRRDVMRRMLGPLLDAFRDYGLMIQRTCPHGRQCYDMYEEALENYEAGLNDIFPEETDRETTI